MSFGIRNATADDIEKIMEIEKSAFIPEIQENRGLFMERIELFQKGFLIFFEKESRKTAGYLSSELWKKVPSSETAFSIGHEIKDFHCDDGSVLYISSFAILPGFRGQGNGLAFFSMALDYIRQSVPSMEYALLLVNEKWQAALKIYGQYGFAEKFRIENVFPDGAGNYSDGIVMALSVKISETHDCISQQPLLGK